MASDLVAPAPPPQVGINQSLVAGLCQGAVYAIVFFTYALAFIYGTCTAARDRQGGRGRRAASQHSHHGHLLPTLAFSPSPPLPSLLWHHLVTCPALPRPSQDLGASPPETTQGVMS